jgi:FkbM family methyltransferase
MFRVALSGMNIETWRADQRDERLFLRRLGVRLSDAPIVFDVGANTGQYLSLVRSEWPHARVYSFEPNPRAFGALKRAADGVHVAAENMALGAEVGSATLFDKVHQPGSQHATTVSGVMEEIYGVETDKIVVTMDTVDHYSATHSVPRIDLLKIDVEGSEIQVIRGARDLIRSGKILAIQLEFNTMNIVSRTFMRDIIDAIPGYAIFRILNNGDLFRIDRLPITQRELFGYQNIVALAPSVAG